MLYLHEFFNINFKNMLRAILFLFSLNLEYIPFIHVIGIKNSTLSEVGIVGQISLCDLDRSKFKNIEVCKDFRIFIIENENKIKATFSDRYTFSDNVNYTIVSSKLITGKYWEKINLDIKITEQYGCFDFSYDIHGIFTKSDTLKEFPSGESYFILEHNYHDQLSEFITKLIGSYEKARS